MNRRRFLAVTAAAGLAGCQGTPSDPAAADADAPAGTASGSPTGTPTPEASGGPATTTAAEGGEFPVDESALRRGTGKDVIPAITDPAFGSDWRGVEIEVVTQYAETYTIEPRLGDDDEVMGLVRDGTARAYPLRLLNWHEVVNDGLGGPLLVTYCPLCRTGVVADRRVNGEATTFGVSGLLWKANLVMYDELTDSLWSQIAATAIRGAEAGEELELVPSTVTSWAEWREAHPGTEVLLPPPRSGTVNGEESTRDYTLDPYAGYDSSDRVGLGREDADDRLHPKTLVVGVSDGGAARAYPFEAVESAGVVNDRVGSLPVVVTTDAGGALVAYDRRVDGGVVEFAAGDARTIVGGGSTWRRSSGAALDGPHEGSTLDRANDRSPMFWFSWADIFPESDIFGRSG